MTLKAHIINALASAAALGAATTLIGLKVNDARQDQQLAQLESLDTSVQGLRGDIEKLDSHLSLVDGKLQRDEQQQDTRR